MTKFLQKNKFFKSIRFNIIVLVLLAGLIPSIILSMVLLQMYERRSISAKEINVITQSQVLVTRLVTNGYAEDEISDASLEAQIDLLASYYDGRIMVIDSGYKVLYDTYGMDDKKTIVSQMAFDALGGTDSVRYDSDNSYIEAALPIKDSDSDTVYGAILLSVSTGEITGNIIYMMNNAAIITVAVVLLIGIIAVFGSYKLIKPFNNISDTIDQMQMDYENEPLSITDYAETEKISEAFNEMLSRMKTLDDSRQEFVSNVSHELKTPLAAVKVLADSLRGQEDVPVELYREFMEDIGEEIDRENEIINDLLSLVKLDLSTGVLNISDVNVNEMVSLCIKRLEPLSGKKNLEIVFENLRPVIAQIDEVKMTLAITNLIENAIKYNVEGGFIHIGLNADDDFFYLKVEDSGIGMEEEDLNMIFERFYRADKSHSKEISGTGLGLAIVRNTVLMHRGAIKADSKPGEGSTFTMRIPLKNMS